MRLPAPSWSRSRSSLSFLSFLTRHSLLSRLPLIPSPSASFSSASCSSSPSCSSCSSYSSVPSHFPSQSLPLPQPGSFTDVLLLPFPLPRPLPRGTSCHTPRAHRTTWPREMTCPPDPSSPHPQHLPRPFLLRLPMGISQRWIRQRCAPQILSQRTPQPRSTLMN